LANTDGSGTLLSGVNGSGLGIYGTFSNTAVAFFSNSSERMRIDSSGNVGIGTSSPSSLLTVGGNPPATGVLAAVSTSGNIALAISDNVNSSLYIRPALGGTVIGTDAGGVIRFATNGNTVSEERMRIDASGNVGIGTGSPTERLTVAGTIRGTVVTGNRGSGEAVTNGGLGLSIDGVIQAQFVSPSSSTAAIYTGGSERMRITSAGEVYIAGTTDQGAYNLQVNGTGVWGAGAYVNGSDERIKDDIAPIASGLDVVEKLNPVTYRYKESWTKDQSVQTGFIAQELLTALEGQVYVDGVVQQGGSEGYYSVAYQNIIPILTKAIQELKTELDTVKAELATLKGN
jgi:hypothetical protein